MRKRAAPPSTIDEYLAGVPEPARSTLRKVRAAVRAAAPRTAAESIGYGIPMFRYKGGLVSFAAFKKHCSFFPMSLAVIASMRSYLKDLDVEKGTIRFPLDKPLPKALITRIVEARVAEQDRKKALPNDSLTTSPSPSPPPASP